MNLFENLQIMKEASTFESEVDYSVLKQNDIDFFATIIEGKCYIVPVEEASGKQKSLRFKPPKNGQKEGISFAKDYELLSQLEKLKEE